MMLEKIKKELEAAAESVGFISQIVQIDETANTLKVRLLVNKTCFIQVYANVRQKLLNYVVVFNGQRIFGLDCVGGKWHSHPWQNPDKHELAKKMSFADFLFGVYQELNAKGII